MKRKLLSILLAAAVVCTSLSSGFVTEAAPETEAIGTTYYVSTIDGNDKNSGTSENEAFYSLEKINNITLQPGDQVLLECGSVFVNEALHVKGSGTEDAPIVIGKYGTGNLPRIETNGQGIWYQNYGGTLDSSSHKWHGYVSSAVLLYDVEYITVRDLEITNEAPEIETTYNATDVMNRTGVAAVVQNIGTADGIHLDNLYIHDVIGNVYDKHMNNGGIYFTAFKPANEEETGVARYNNVLIENCYVDNVNRWGIAVGYTYKHAQFTAVEISDDTVAAYGSGNVVIRNNYVKDAGGDAITLMYCDRPLVEYNVSDGIAKQINETDYSATSSGRVAAGIWPWKCKDAVFQYNEAFDTCYNQDGQAWDADSGDGTIYQYNYSHNNEGGCVMFCYPESANNTFRYNISQNDLAGIMSPSRNPDAKVYNNTFYIAEDVPFIRDGQSGGTMHMENNIFYYAGETARTENWTYGGTSATYDNNLYYNYENTPASDANAISVAAGTSVLENPGSAPTTPKSVTPGAITSSITYEKTLFAGYTPVEDSPAIDAGKVIEDNGNLDFMGNTLFGTPDIGAIETGAIALNVQSDVYKLDHTDKIISEVAAGTTVADFLANFSCAADSVKIMDGTTEVTSGNVAPGMTVVLSVSGEDIITYTIAGVTEIVRLGATSLSLNETTSISGERLQTITWTMSNEGIVRIDQANNMIKAIGAGTTTLTATFASGTVKTIDITVTDKIAADIPRTEFAGITATANTAQAATGNESAAATVDGDSTTFWHSAYDFEISETNPAILTVDLGTTLEIDGFKFQQREQANRIFTQFSYRIMNADGEVVAAAEHVTVDPQAQKVNAWGNVLLNENVSARTIEFSVEMGASDHACVAEFEPIRATKIVSDEQPPVEEPSVCTHQWGAWTVTKEATVLAEGMESHTCSICNAAETRVIKKLDPTIETNAQKDKITLQKKQTSKGFKITGLAKGDSIVSITTSNKKVVKVTKVNKAKGTCTLKAGKLTGKKGKATITITLASGLKKTIKVSVQTGKVKTTKITGLENYKKLSLTKGKRVALKPVLVPFTSQDKVKFTTSNKKVATVTSKGKITAKKKGKATITVKAGKKKVKVKVTVK